MIARLEGKVAYRSNKYLVLLTVSGLGYKVFASPDVLEKHSPESECALWTHHALREDAEELYGFESVNELHFFELLISISGIGPKTALNILSLAGIHNLKKAISQGETSHLVKVAGLGKKMADKIVLELKGKLVDEKEEESGALKEEVDAIEALKALGYSHKEAREALKLVPANATSASERIKSALKILGK